MDWMNVEPDVYRLINKHYTPGRGGQKIKYIVRHHNAGILTIDGCWQVWQDRPASAHYQVENSGRIGQLVNDSDTAWHAANQLRNQQSIGIEHANSGGADQDWPISDTVIKQGARLAAALCRYYKLGRPEYGKNIRDHKETGSTSCPYHLAYGGKYHQAWMNEAQRFYDELTGKSPGKKPTPQKGPLMALSDQEQRELLEKIRTIHHELTHRFQTRVRNQDGNIEPYRDTLVGYVLETDRKVEDMHKNMLPSIWRKLTSKLGKENK